MNRYIVLLLCAAALVTAFPAAAGPERVTFPEDFRTEYVLYGTSDRVDLKAVRMLYAPRWVLEQAVPGDPLPDGTIIAMEQVKARVNKDGELVKDAQDRLIPTDETMIIAVAEKHAGWGETVDSPIKNGDWDYGFYKPDGTLNMEAPYPKCFECHAPLAAQDYNFTLFNYIKSAKK